MGTTGVNVGERLRAIRRQKGLSLHDVEARSNLEFKASVLGAYERGERAISVPRLLRLAEIYEVPPDQLLPRELEHEISLVDSDSGAGHGHQARHEIGWSIGHWERIPAQLVRWRWYFVETAQQAPVVDTLERQVHRCRTDPV